MLDKIMAVFIVLGCAGLLSIGVACALVTFWEIACDTWKGIKWAVKKVRR